MSHFMGHGNRYLLRAFGHNFNSDALVRCFHCTTGPQKRKQIFTLDMQIRPYKGPAGNIMPEGRRMESQAPRPIVFCAGISSRLRSEFYLYHYARSRYRNVTIWARVQLEFGEKVVSVVPLV